MKSEVSVVRSSLVALESVRLLRAVRLAWAWAQWVTADPLGWGSLVAQRGEG